MWACRNVEMKTSFLFKEYDRLLQGHWRDRYRQKKGFVNFCV